MIKVSIYRNDDKVKKFEIKGHAGYDVYDRDIVCAGVTAVAQTAVLGLEAIDTVSIKKKVKDGYMYVEIENYGAGEDVIKSCAIVDAMVLGLKDIERDYPAYVKVFDRRCDG
ncbi:MAG TPA: ribosomal-processing cysteine protease Prp [Thermoanaerobacterium sp.]|nr:ribosomal-processing cysteine protease Prp [Thermoanaerobacterium sp.]